ncbi:hypothetical protein AN958_06298 [Leucoagaricus sp. SymC.cos]|nr:hypothetical protein AN958_06298 [Leucoagaricus sp. SymC.cos]
MDRLTWRPDEGRGAADPTESVGASQEITNSTHPQEPHHSRTAKEVLFPGLEYLSFYDIGSTSPGKLAGMLRSRIVQGVVPDEPRDANSEVPQTSNPVTKLKVLETWHWFASLNDISDVEWEQIEGLREHGLVFRLFKSSDSGSYMSDAEKELLRRYVLEEGLVVRDYLHDIGQFAPICLDQETQLSSVV